MVGYIITFKIVFKAGYPALSLHGGMDQYDRDSVLSDYKKGLSNLLIGNFIFTLIFTRNFRVCTYVKVSFVQEYVVNDFGFSV